MKAPQKLKQNKPRETVQQQLPCQASQPAKSLFMGLLRAKYWFNGLIFVICWRWRDIFVAPLLSHS